MTSIISPLSISAQTLHPGIDKMIKQMDPIQYLIIAGIIITSIVFSDNMPSSIQLIIDSTLGRISSIILILLITIRLGWTYGILLTLSVLLILSGTPKINEGFDNQIIKRTIGHRWFAESILSETPEKINTDVVGISENQISNDIIGHKWLNENILQETPNKIITDVVITPTISDMSSQKNIGM